MGYGKTGSTVEDWEGADSRASDYAGRIEQKAEQQIGLSLAQRVAAAVVAAGRQINPILLLPRTESTGRHKEQHLSGNQMLHLG
ncbi:hypothetical protein Y1Q_0013673 [Alligator mississippiensis]|uniref:Uncharacterized protein n=1 Tax=Alligator mississippiensis TaxID=8496 RepID=A0A151P427_ALLMI|nr:hypothetical protein Y1Q_0013673 [Alligator mississippiensis]